MPRAPAFKINALADLLRQLEYAPVEARRRHMDAAETLAADIDPDLAYPREFVIYRITGYRTEADDMVTFAGAALRQDLINLVQRLSGTLDLPAARKGRAAMTLEEVAERLGVSAKTVQRYRREGLICHVVAQADGASRLACYEDALERFEATRQESLRRASRFTRIGEDTEALIIGEARRLREARAISLSAAARLIANRHGRAHETIRQILRRHDRHAARAGSDGAAGGDGPIFSGERGPLSPREIAVAHRAWQRGVDLRPMAQRYERSRPAILRAVNRRRAELLRGLKVHHIEMPTFAMEGADAVILSSAAATSELLALPPHDEAFKLLDWASVAESIDEALEDALLGGWNLLKRRAARGIAALADDDDPAGETVDVIETDLRWATRLHRRLALAAFPAALRRIEGNLGRSLIAHSADQIETMIRLSAGVIRESLEGVDPLRGQRLERMISFAMERALAQRGTAPPASSKASARHAPGAAITLRGAFDALDEWEPWLEPWSHARARLAGLSDVSRSVLTMRFGWDGRPPLTMRAMAGRLQRHPPVVARQLQQAIRELRAAVRT